jgi:hypothetical protein
MIGVEAGGTGAETGRARARFNERPAAAPECCRQRAATCCRTRRADSSTHSISAGLDYPSIGPEHSCTSRAASNTSRPPTTRRSKPSSCLQARRHHPGARIRARRRACLKLAPTLRARQSWSSTSGRGDKGRGDKDVSRISDAFMRLRREGRRGFIPSSRRATRTSRRRAPSSSSSRARARPLLSWACPSATPSPTAP